MAIREYIGARYVPIFDGEWDGSKTYEPLVIVSYQGNSYTSRKYVPAGVPVSNAEYWAESGNFSGQVEQLRTELGQLADRVTADEGDIDTAQGDIVSLQASVSDLYRANINYWRGKNIVFIGDSYTYGTGASDHGSGDTKRFSSRICAWLQANEFNYGVGSTGFVDPGSGGQNSPFTTQVQTAVASMTAQERADTRAVIIAGGINDANEGTYTFNQMKQAATNACIAAYSGFPNAIVLVVPMMWKGFNFTPTALNYYDAIIDGVKACYRAEYEAGAYTWNWGDSSHFASDNLHPNDTGHQIIARNIISALRWGNTECWEDHIYPVTYSSADFEDSTNAENYIAIRRGVVYMQPLMVKSLAAVSSNTQFATIPKAAAPRANEYSQCNHGNGIVGVTALTANGALYVNPHLNALAANDGFYTSFTAYNLWGSGYNS